MELAIPVYARAMVEERRALSVPGTRFAPRMEEFERLLRSSLTGVVVCPPPDEAPEVYRWLWGVTISQPAADIICVTRFEEEWLLPLAGVSCAAILSLDEIDASLGRKLAEFTRPDIRRFLDRLALAAAVLRRPSRDALKAMCDPNRSPVVEVALIPDLVASSTSSFYEAWSLDFPDCTPKRVTDWIALARVLERGGTPASSSRWLGVHVRTLERVWIRCTGRSMRSSFGLAAIPWFLHELAACAEPIMARAMRRQWGE